MTTGKITDINLVETGTLVNNGGVWVLPLSNLLDTYMIAKPARCEEIGTLTKSRFKLSFADETEISMLCLMFHTLSEDATVRLRIKDAVNNNINDSLDFEPVFPNGIDDAAKLYPRHYTVIFDPPLTTAKFIFVDFDDQTNPDGYFDIGYFWVANAWSPAFNFEHGRTLKVLSRDLRDESLSGHQHSEYRQPRRMLSVNYADLTKDEVYRFLDMSVRAGRTNPVLFIADADDVDNRPREVFPATLDTLPGATFSIATKHRSSLSLAEIIR